MEDCQFQAVDYVRIEVGAGGQRQVFEMRSLDAGVLVNHVEIRQVLNVGGGFDESQRVAEALEPIAPARVEFCGLASRSSLTLEITGGVAVIGRPERVVPGEEGKR